MEQENVEVVVDHELGYCVNHFVDSCGYYLILVVNVDKS